MAHLVKNTKKEIERNYLRALIIRSEKKMDRTKQKWPIIFIRLRFGRTML